MKRFRPLLAALTLLIVLPACWDQKTIQDISYPTAIGIDYQDGEYIVYGQLLNFSRIAKTNPGQGNGDDSTYVGVGRHSNFNRAISNLYHSAQQTVFWGHVTAIILGKGVLDRGVTPQDFDGFVRFREMRFTQWVWGTDEPIDEILKQEAFFGKSPLSTILHQPRDTYKQLSLLKPMLLQEFLAQLREPSNTVRLPELSITDMDWRSRGKVFPQMYLAGLYAIQQEKPAIRFEVSEFFGLRWLDANTVRSPLVLTDKNGEEMGTLMLIRPKSSIHYVSGAPEKPVFDVEVVVDGFITEVFGKVEETELERAAEEKIREEINSTFDSSVNKNADLFGLGHEMYRHNLGIWRSLTELGSKPIPTPALGTVSVNVDLKHGGMYKLRRETAPY